jgi:hypothetical protein
MRWLIVEDALPDRKGHWFEYVETFARELRALGNQVKVLADRAAEPFLVEQLQVQPVLPVFHLASHGRRRRCACRFTRGERIAA